MNRVRISTTVDATLLARARASACAANDAELIDRALTLLTRTINEEHERDILIRLPYHLDPDLAMPPTPPSNDGLPYDGAVPPAVQALAEARRGRQ